MNLVKVSQADKAGLPFRPATFYSWHHTGRNAEIFIKEGSLFVDVDRLNALLESRRRKGKKQ
jgi:hypothetical protein